MEAACSRYFKADKTRGRPSIAPGVYFRMLLVGYFEGIESERGLEWRCSDSLSLREFLGLLPEETVPDHSTLSRMRKRFGTEMPPSSETPQDPLPAVIPDFDGNGIRSGHAMLIAGYRVTSNGAYFLLHNSWSRQWGDEGYAWNNESTLLNNLRSAYTVDAEPIGPTPVPPRNETPTQCPEELLPDSITAQCAPACPDGSARHNAVCAESSQCPQGYVNLSGECVVAAPTARGLDPASNIRYNCAPGGCSYVVPFGLGGCILPWCTLSCPSPRFQLAVDAGSLACVE